MSQKRPGGRSPGPTTLLLGYAPGAPLRHALLFGTGPLPAPFGVRWTVFHRHLRPFVRQVHGRYGSLTYVSIAHVSARRTATPRLTAGLRPPSGRAPCATPVGSVANERCERHERTVRTGANASEQMCNAANATARWRQPARDRRETGTKHGSRSLLLRNVSLRQEVCPVQAASPSPCGQYRLPSEGCQDESLPNGGRRSASDESGAIIARMEDWP